MRMASPIFIFVAAAKEIEEGLCPEIKFLTGRNLINP
jgi:hypothetical protein